MRPLLTDYKLCKYINKFYVSFTTPFTLAPAWRAPPISQSVHGKFFEARFMWCRSIEHVALGWQGFLCLPSHHTSPTVPSGSHCADRCHLEKPDESLLASLQPSSSQSNFISATTASCLQQRSDY